MTMVNYSHFVLFLILVGLALLRRLLMALVYTSSLLDFSGDENTPIIVNHNVGQCPDVVKIEATMEALLDFQL